MILEGIVLFLITQTLLRKTKREGMVIFVWLICYGIFRTLVEFIRIPDEQIGYILNLVTMGQILSFTMIIAGLAGIFFYHPRKHEAKI
jgi:phosphatidylglycerol:prolipoprotein diacylglycerol transferase